MTKKLQKAMNEQIKNEFASAYLYLGMAAYFESVSLSGFANWMKMQAQEETIHAMKFFEYMHDTGAPVELLGIEKPENDFKSPLDIFEKTLAHEKKVTALINNLYKIAEESNDNASKIFLQWFITEQVEEEKSASEIIDKLKFVKNDSAAIFYIDSELAKRPAPQPAAE